MCWVWLSSCRTCALSVIQSSIAARVQPNHASNNRSTCSCCRIDDGACHLYACHRCLVYPSERLHWPWSPAKVLTLQQTVVPLVRLLHADLSIRDATASARAHQHLHQSQRKLHERGVTWQLRTATKGQGNVFTGIRVWRRWVRALHPAARSARSRGARRRPAGAA